METKELSTKELIKYSYSYLGVRFDRRKATVKELIRRFGESKAREMVNNVRNAEIRRFKQAVAEPRLMSRSSFIFLLKNSSYNPEAYSSRYNCTGIDWCAYVRRSKSEKGAWVFIAPDEPANNVFVPANTIYAKFLEKKYK
jgi:hypothetical protein